MKIMKEKGGHLPLPVDVVVAHHIGYDAGFRICDLDDIEADEMILDIRSEDQQDAQRIPEGR